MPTKKTVSLTTYKLTLERVIRKYENTIALSNKALSKYKAPSGDMPGYDRYVMHKTLKEHAEVMLDMIHKYIKP